MKFRKKPIIIEAVQLKKTQVSIREITELMGESVDINNKIELVKFYEFCDIVFSRGYMEIKTLEGTMRANIGNWIIKGVNGEFYPCKPNIFEKTYEMIE